MAMTIGKIPTELEKIAGELDRKGMFDVARRLRDMRTFMVAQPPAIPGLAPRPGQEPIALKHGGAIAEIIAKLDGDVAGVRRGIDELKRLSGGGSQMPTYSAPKPAIPQLKRVRQY